MRLENLIRELRLMKSQPTHRFYAAVGLVLVALLRHALLTAAAALLSWHQLK